MEITLSALDDATTALASAVSANTDAVNKLIAAHAATEPTTEQLQAIAAQTAAVEASTAAIDTALAPPAAPAA